MNTQDKPQARQQLTLFVKDIGIIEEIRKEFNPVQYELISAHVTLCREDEITPISKVLENIKALEYDRPIVINFDSVERFENGKGVWLPASTDNHPFQELRKKILKGVIDNPRQHRPHITLMHPGNSTCTDDIFHSIKQCRLPNRLWFDKVSLIEQKQGGRWTILDEYYIISESAKVIIRND